MLQGDLTDNKQSFVDKDRPKVECQFRPKPKVTPKGGYDFQPKPKLHRKWLSIFGWKPKPKPKVHATYHYTHASSHRRLRKQ